MEALPCQLWKALAAACLLLLDWLAGFVAAAAAVLADAAAGFVAFAAVGCFDVPVMSRQHLLAAACLTGFGEISAVDSQSRSSHHSQHSKSAAC